MLTEQSLTKSWEKIGRYEPVSVHLTFHKNGLLLGAGTVIAPSGRDDWGRPVLKIDGNEERILALLSVAHDQPIMPRILNNLRSASRCWSKGEITLAYIHIAFSNLQVLEDEDAPRRLFMAKRLIDHGMDEAEMLKGLGLFPRYFTPWSWRQVIKEFNPDQPRVPAGCSEGGQFCSGNGEALKLPGNEKRAARILSRARHQPDPNASPREKTGDDPVSAMPPTYKRGSVGQSHWNGFHEQLSDMGTGDNTRVALGETMAAEGSIEKDQAGTAYTGIKQGTLDDLRQYDPSLPQTPDEMNIKQAAEAHYFLANRELKDVGGVRALEEISGPENAAALWDVIVREGRTGGMTLVNRACGEVTDNISEKEQQRLGLISNPRNFAEKFKNYKRLTADPKYAQDVRNKLSNARNDKRPNESDRNDHFRFNQ